MSVKTPTIEISLENTNHMEEAVKLFGKGIAAFAGLEHALSVVTLKDPAVSNPSYHNRESISIIPRGGKTTITPEKYMDFIENFQPDIFHALSDGDTSESCAKKRIINAIDRTEYFFDKCLERYKNSPILTNSMLLGMYPSQVSWSHHIITNKIYFTLIYGSANYGWIQHSLS